MLFQRFHILFSYNITLTNIISRYVERYTISGASFNYKTLDEYIEHLEENAVAIYDQEWIDAHITKEDSDITATKDVPSGSTSESSGYNPTTTSAENQERNKLSARTYPDDRQTPTLRTLNGSQIQRSRAYSVGKQMGSQVYVHKDYASEVVPRELNDTPFLEHRST